MNKSELRRFQAILTARVGELERLAGHREGITIERDPSKLQSVHLQFVISTAISSSCEMPAPPFAVSREGTYGTSFRSSSSRRRGAPFCIRCQEAADRNPEEMQTPTHDILARAA